MLRHRKIDEGNEDRQPVYDRVGSPVNLVNPGRPGVSEPAGYVADAWGESITPGGSGTQPAEENHIRFHGGFVEEFLSSGDGDAFYRMGARHYSTVLGRFLQRDPWILGILPNNEYPLSVNPYLYGLNRPTQMRDTSGLQATFGGCPGCGGSVMPARPPGGAGRMGPGDKISIPPSACRRGFQWPFVPGASGSGGGGGTEGPVHHFQGDVEGCDLHYPQDKCCPDWNEEFDPDHCCCILKNSSCQQIYAGQPGACVCCRHLWSEGMKEGPEKDNAWCYDWCCDIQSSYTGGNGSNGGVATQSGTPGTYRPGRPIGPSPKPEDPIDPWFQPHPHPKLPGPGGRQMPEPMILPWAFIGAVAGALINYAGFYILGHLMAVCTSVPHESECWKHCCGCLNWSINTLGLIASAWGLFASSKAASIAWSSVIIGIDAWLAIFAVPTAISLLLSLLTLLCLDTYCKDAGVAWF